MKKHRSTRNAILLNVVSLVLCFSMLIGTTFAWFTDSVTSDGNIIQTGTLDIEMYWAQGKEDPSNATWQDASNGAIFNNNEWEPGYTEARHIKIENKGSLALQYKIIIVANGEVTDLADVIDVYYVDPAAQIATRDALAGVPKLGTLKETLATLDESASGYLAKGESDTITIALKMKESAGNEYQDLSLCDGGFSIQLLATQAVGEFDSFGNDYDKIAAADFFPGFQGGSASITVALDDAGITSGKSVIDTGDAAAIIPSGVKLADGNNRLELTVTIKDSTESNVILGENEKMRPLDVHIEGVAADNTTPMLIILENYMTTGINTGAIRIYHVENGVTVPMTQVTTPVNHNEFSYDPSTGDVTLALASFSEVAVVADTNNPWDGETVNYLWYNASATELTIYNADQLAGFAAIVDGKAEGIAQDNFDGKTVKLANNIYLSGKLFDPIGWGYVNTEWNRDGASGKVFMGTFDGNGKTIFDLYQSGWDLEEKTGTDYTYTNCGFGLFAAASNATFKNLTISGAYVRVECVEAGVLVGLSQNNCTYDNIQIHNSKIANYQRPAGGLIGEVSGEGTTKITNVTIGSDVVVGSLWGDFDAPCGGVIGARWDDAGKNPQIVMQYVEVGARMDVYSDVTSAYQWYAYRRAGMLIGNTELTDPNNKHLAYANFLKCENVKVYYGNWAAYHYCQFTNQDNSWCNNYPWVRVETGENCSAYSNPRYGQPVIGGTTVSTDTHTCTGEHKMELRFSQLYGGGQGVYGQPVHDGVEVINYRYSITYVNDYQVLAIKYVTENGAVSTANSAAQDLVVKWANTNIGEGKFMFGGWMNAGSTKVENISADNTKDIVLYPYFNNPYTARFVDQNGNVLVYCFFHKEDTTKLEAKRIEAEAALPDPGDGFEFDYWEVHITDSEGKTTSKKEYDKFDFANCQTDVTIYPVYKYDGDVKLIPVDSDGDGTINYYQVSGYSNPNGQELVEIPAYVNGKPVTTVNADAFSSYDDLHSVRIPGTITEINSQSFTANNGTGRDTVTLYYEGDPAVWNEAMTKYNNKDYSGMLKQSWDNYMGESSCVFFLDENGKVDLSKGYWELAKTGGFIGIGSKFVWQYHNHAYGSNSGCSNEHNNKTVYTDQCDCDLGKHYREDAKYWN